MADGHEPFAPGVSALAVALARLIDGCIQELRGNESVPSEKHILLLLIQGVGVSANSIGILANHSEMGSRDCFGISRSICETCANISYLCVEDEEISRQAKSHATARIVRDTKRTAEFLDMQIAVAREPTFDAVKDPAIAQSIAEFTSKRGAEISHWTNVSLDQRIEKVAERSISAGRKLAASKFLIFGYASEVMHGSFYGVVYFWTALDRIPKSSQEAKDRVTNHLLHAIGAAFLAVSGMIDVLHDAYSIPRTLADAKSLHEKLKTLFDELNYQWRDQPTS